MTAILGGRIQKSFTKFGRITDYDARLITPFVMVICVGTAVYSVRPVTHTVARSRRAIFKIITFRFVLACQTIPKTCYFDLLLSFSFQIDSLPMNKEYAIRHAVTTLSIAIADHQQTRNENHVSACLDHVNNVFNPLWIRNQVTVEAFL